MKIVLLTCASTKEKWLSEVEGEYLKKISRFYNFSIQSLKPFKSDRSEKAFRVEKETHEILKQIKDDDLIILFDERGTSFSSLKFAKFFESQLGSGKKRIFFIIGGPFGVGETLKERADHLIKLSDFTFNHLVAELAALEQIYRACTIIHNHPYHNE